MYLTVVLRKEIADRIEGLALIDAVKQKLADQPEVSITGNITEHIEAYTPPVDPD